MSVVCYDPTLDSEPLFPSSVQTHKRSILTLLVLAFVLVAPAGASSLERISVTLKPGQTVQRVSHQRFGAHEQVGAVVTVDGAELAYVGSGQTVDFAGRGVIVRLKSALGNGPICVRMASVRMRAVRVVVELRG